MKTLIQNYFKKLTLDTYWTARINLTRLLCIQQPNTEISKSYNFYACKERTLRLSQEFLISRLKVCSKVLQDGIRLKCLSIWWQILNGLRVILNEFPNSNILLLKSGKSLENIQETTLDACLIFVFRSDI